MLLRIILTLNLVFSCITLKSQFSNERIFLDEKRNYIKEVITIDLDKDGDLDLIVASSLDVTLLENNGNKEYLAEKLLFESFTLESVEVVDIDNDMDLDFVVADAISIYIIKNDGEGNFQNKKELHQYSLESFIRPIYPSRVSDIMVDDINKDGNIDIIYNDRETDVVVWHKNIGDGNFSDQIVISRETGDFSLTSYNLGDLDNDGNKDIVINIGPTLSWYKIDSNGDFSEELIISDNLEEAIREILISDFDKDGNMDVVTLLNTKIDYYKGNAGAIEFSKKRLMSHQKAIETLVIKDFDNDLDLDIAYTYISSDRRNLVWLENFSNGVFSRERPIDTKLEDRANYIYAHDINFDGNFDLILTAEYEPFKNKIAFYENHIGFPTIEGRAFWDKNNNQIYDDSDFPVQNFLVQVTPNPLSSFSDENGYFRLYVDNGEYEILGLPDSCWEVSTDYANQVVNIEGGISQEVIYPLNSISNFKSSKVRINSGRTRCGFSTLFNLSIENDGCNLVNGKFGLVLSNLVRVVEMQTEPVEIKGDTLLWTYEELTSGENYRIDIVFEIAGTDFIGEFIELIGLSYIEDEFGNHNLANTYNYSSEIRCAYDPNDKLVNPNRLNQYSENYTLFEESLEYTIRFQNTGTDTAFNVSIRDTLDKNLEWTTFRPVMASHPYEAFSQDDGAVEFSFRDILLPDSTTNEPLSHGFVTYKISPKQELPENTKIENTASIYFDFNPPIVTNTIENIMVSVLPTTTSTNTIISTKSMQIDPNPFNNFLLIKSVSEFNKQLRISFFDVTGKEIKTEILQSMNEVIKTTNFNKGIYFYHVTDQIGNTITNGKLIKK